MDWAQLISTQRFKAPAEEEPQRTPFQRDFDRIVFSAAFRRLQDKTQVHPFPNSDYIRRRLTHSLEVSCVGRSLGADLGNYLVNQHSTLISGISETATLPFDLGQIVANACLAHDIGNPPFGHAGEKAIGSSSRSTFLALSDVASLHRSWPTFVGLRAMLKASGY